MDEWQPIETAPKDTALLLYTGWSYAIGHFNTLPDISAWVDGFQHRKLEHPTHWMPLPKAPIVKPTKKESNFGQ